MRAEIFEPPGRPIPFETVRRVFRRRILDGAHWVAVFDRDSSTALEHIEVMFYRGNVRDLDKVVIDFFGERFTIVALPKARMRKWQYEQVLSGYGVKLPGAGVIERDGLLCVCDSRMEKAFALAEAFTTTGDDLALES